MIILRGFCLIFCLLALRSTVFGVGFSYLAVDDLGSSLPASLVAGHRRFFLWLASCTDDSRWLRTKNGLTTSRLIRPGPSGELARLDGVAQPGDSATPARS